MVSGDPFSTVHAEELDELARHHDFKRRGQRNWIRRTPDFIQLINLQRSQWSSEDHYLNFALWPLAMGEPPSLAESKFHFRARAGDMGAINLSAFFSCADRLCTLDDLRAAEKSGTVTGLMTTQLQGLLHQR